MKVILLVDDKKLGKKNSIIDVADGYARNVLIPKKIVEQATPDALNRLNNRIAHDEFEYKKQVDEATAVKKQLDELKELVVKVNSNNGKMFGAFTSADVVDSLITYDIHISKKNVVMPNSIKTLGKYPIKIKLFSGIYSNLTLKLI